MSENQARLSAHERLSSGALASWMRACASHPWRVMITWVGIIAALILLVGTVGGQPQGRVRDPGLRHAEGDRPDRGRVRVRAGRRAEPRVRGARGRAARHARASRRDRGGGPVDPGRRVRADGDGPGRRGGHHQRRRSLLGSDVLRRRPDRVRGGAVRPRDLRGGSRAGRRRPGRGSRSGRAGRRDRRVQRRRRVPADRAGHAGAPRPAGRADRAADRVPHDRRHGDPARTRDRRAHDRVPPALHPRRPHRHQHDHPAARVDDRARRRHRLLAVHRDALPAVPARRAVAA